MNKIIIRYHETPCGTIVLGSIDGKLCLCDWLDRKSRKTIDMRLKQYFNAEIINGDCTLISKALIQINEYFAKNRRDFDLPLALAGTRFQQHVWQQLQLIPFGETVSYMQLAQRVGNTKAVRAVANANGANALSIIIPCHRVVGSNGQLTGYAGGLDAKQSLLTLERLE